DRHPPVDRASGADGAATRGARARWKPIETSGAQKPAREKGEPESDATEAPGASIACASEGDGARGGGGGRRERAIGAEERRGARGGGAERVEGRCPGDDAGRRARAVGIAPRL